jgi:glycosyltransferase involved in cell wall biosynthesis
LEHRPDYRFVFVDDGSTDNTGRLLDDFCAGSVQCTVVRLPANRGKGAAVKEGLERALADGCEYLGYWDADLAASLESSEDQLDLLEGDGRIVAVLGVRVRLLGHDVGQNLFRRLAGRTFARVVSASLGVSLHDPQCGHKLFRNCEETVRAFAEPFRSRWLFDIEILARLMRFGPTGREELGTKIRELPLRDVKMGPGSKVRLSSFITAMVDFGRIWTSEILPARRAVAQTRKDTG